MTNDEETARTRNALEGDRTFYVLVVLTMSSAGSALLRAREVGVYDVHPPVLVTAVLGSMAVFYGIGRLPLRWGRSIAGVLAAAAMIAELVLIRMRAL